MILELKIYLISWLISNFEPLQDLINKIWSYIPIKISSIKIIDYIYILFGCQKCLTLWIGLIFLDPYSALLLSFIAYLQEKIII